MEINSSTLEKLFTGYKASFAKGFTGTASVWPKIAMKVTSTTRLETYAWLGQFPKMREWLGDRVVNMLLVKAMELKNKDFESTIAVPRNDIEDDQFGIYAPVMEEMGRGAAELPDELVFAVLAGGFTTLCYDGQMFFDTDHPVKKGADVVSVANTDGGNGAPWYLLDTSRAVRPFIYQERRAANLVSKTNETDDNVFWRKEYIYGVDSRGAAGYGFWQLAWGSKQPLDSARFAAAMAAMQGYRGDEDRLLGIRPTVLVVGPDNELAARKLIKATTLENGESNPWKDAVELIVSPWVA
ncbi:Mu-like prophage major head subunit gpT family protein [Rhizobium sp. P007]|uniref:Mu-like prophage major head subunit gpT family protein n=1 Tax=Rhizobium sp. P007 TaxID=285908 RepID=UPI00115BC1DA|nr:Mu-like prophage major head subunit gpT family protein [Rhizobium sp. P007]CAD7058259.1 phage head protein [Rhizobium sp. P007]